MTAEQFWDGDPALTKYYRRADEIRDERRNRDLWLQGMYIYEALCDTAPVLHAFAKKGAKPRPYSDRPYPLTEKQRRREEQERERERAAKGRRFMETLQASVNGRFGKKTEEGGEPGGNDNRIA